ncbi:MAG: hypothetical protein AAFU61_18345, partial [Pseudomonadota bacterium]
LVVGVVGAGASAPEAAPEEDLLFSVCFTSHQNFTQIMRIVQAVQDQVAFRLVSDVQEGDDIVAAGRARPCSLRVGCMDASTTCACKARLRCVGFKAVGTIDFALPVGRLLTIVHSPGIVDRPIRMFQRRGDPRVGVTCAENTACQFHLRGLDQAWEGLPFHEIESCYTLS